MHQMFLAGFLFFCVRMRTEHRVKVALCIDLAVPSRSHPAVHLLGMTERKRDSRAGVAEQYEQA